MALKIGTQATEDMLGALKTTFDLGILKIFGSPRPASSDAAETGTVLAEITAAGATYTPADGTNGLTFEAAAAGILAKTTAQVWADLSANASGVATWYRFYPKGSAVTGASTTVSRIDGSVGTTGSGADLTMASTTITAGEPVYVNTFKWTLPNGE